MKSSDFGLISSKALKVIADVGWGLGATRNGPLRISVRTRSASVSASVLPSSRRPTSRSRLSL
jgi:hypothetical protein